MTQTLVDTLCLFATVNVVMVCCTVVRCVKIKAQGVAAATAHHGAIVRARAGEDQKGYE